MLVVVSPAKRLDESPSKMSGNTKPTFLSEAGELAQAASKLSGPELEKLMHISSKLGALNATRFAAFGTGQGEKPAVELFSCDTYAGLEASTLEPDELAYAQDHLRLLSGLYGLLRPMDAIQPHRLEMGSKLANDRGRNLYEFWGGRIAQALNDQAKSVGTDVLVNCASVEYFKAVDLAALKLRLIPPVSMDYREGGPKIMVSFSKKGRDVMARYIVQRRVTNPEGLKDFDAGGYRFNAKLSDGDKLVFLRSDQG